MGALEGVQTIFFMYYQHTEDILSNLKSLQASQAESSVCPHQASQAETFPGIFLPGLPGALLPTKNFEIFCPSSLKCPVKMPDKIVNISAM